MHRPLAVHLLLAALFSAVATTVSAQCVLGSAVPLQQTSKTLKLTVEKITTAPGYTAAIPLLQETDATCRLHLTPPAGATQFRLEVRPEFTGDGTASQRRELQVVSVDTAAIRVRMSPIEVSNAQTTTADVTIEPLSRAGREYVLAIVARDSTTTDTLSFRLLWAPEPEIRISNGRTNCGAELCFFQGEREEVRFSGTDAGEIARAGRVTVRFFSNNALVETTVSPIEASAEGVFFAVTTRLARVDSVQLQIPLQVARVQGGATVNHVSLSHTAGVEPPTRRPATFSYLDGNRLDVLRGGSAGLPVRLRGRTPLQLSRNGKYALRELVLGVQGTPVAEFHVDDVDGDSATGTLVPIAETRPRTGLDGPPALVLAGNGSQQLRISLVVLPRIRVDKVYVRRAGRPDELGGAVHPLEQVHLRLEGPGVGYLRRGDVAGEAVTLPEVTLHRDTVEVKFRVPANASPTETLRLRDLDGAEVPVTIAVTPNQRPRRDLRFAQLQYRSGSRLVLLPLPDRSGRIPVWTNTLSDVLLRVDPLVVDSTNALYGVQYLLLRADLYDAAGVRVDTVSQCLAVVPPPVEGRVYPTTGNCRRIDNGEFELSELMPAASRATAQSRMEIRLRHDPTQYPTEDAAEVREVHIARSGWLVVEPRLQLPGAVLAWRRGRTTPGITYAGALISMTPMIRNWNKAHHWSAQTGLLIGTTPSTGTGTDDIGGRLSLAGGINYVFTNMVGNVSLDFFFGRVYPISRDGLRERDSYFVFRPGFSVPLGK